MSTLFKHQAAKNCCSGSEQDINTIGMSRQQTNISALDTEALSMEPGKVFKTKNSYLHWNVGRMIPASTWSQEVQSGPFTKKISYNGATAGQHSHWLEGSKLTWAMPPGSWQSTSNQLEQSLLMRKSHQQLNRQSPATPCPQQCNRTMTAAEHKWNKGRPLPAKSQPC